MNSGRAKKIARLVYGDLSRKGAKYFRIPGTGQIVRDDLRRRYQHAKQRYKGMALWMIGAERRKSKRRHQGIKKMHEKNYSKAIK